MKSIIRCWAYSRHLELELKTAKDPEERQEIEQCISGTKRISSTLRGLVNYARPGPLVLSKISLRRLISDTLAFVEHQPMLRGKQLENSVPVELPHIRADANQLSQVLMNLLNAAEATLDRAVEAMKIGAYDYPIKPFHGGHDCHTAPRE